jgi:GT2 family glycosyltransferase
MMVRRDVFEKLGGFEREFLGSGFSVDFCLRAMEAGYLNVFEPRARAAFHGGAGLPGLPGSAADREYLAARFQRLLCAGDLYHSPLRELFGASAEAEDC